MDDVFYDLIDEIDLSAVEVRIVQKLGKCSLGCVRVEADDFFISALFCEGGELLCWLTARGAIFRRRFR